MPMKWTDEISDKKNRQALQRSPIRCFCQHNLNYLCINLKQLQMYEEKQIRG